MKKIFAVIALAFAALTMTACDPKPNLPPVNDSTTTGAGGRIDLKTQAAFLTLASACQGGNITWTYSGTSAPGYNAIVDGSVSPSGIFFAPICGSQLLNTTVTITGTCVDQSNVSRSSALFVKIGDEIVNGVTIVAAQILAGSTCVSSCWANTPTNITIPACPSGQQPQIQFYAAVGTTCSNFYYSPSAPPAPAAQTPKCSSAISP